MDLLIMRIDYCINITSLYSLHLKCRPSLTIRSSIPDDLWEIVALKNVVLSSPVPKPKPQGPAPTQSNSVKISSKGTGADTKILWATHHPHHPPTPPQNF